jgi:hypothetical protein
MDDSFSLGKPARKRALQRSRAPRPVGSQRSGSGVLITVAVLCGALVLAAIVGFMMLMHNGGEQAASADQTAIAQIGAAKDVQAQLTANEAVTAVQQLYAEQGSFQGVDPAGLKQFEPSFTYTSGASTGPNDVSVAAAPGGVGVAVMSGSGTCYFAFDTGSGIRYGTGSPCTGQAAASASAVAWPKP